MAIEDCLRDIILASAGQLSQAQARDLLGRVENLASRYEAQGMAHDAAVMRAALDINDAAEAAAKIAQRNALMNLQKRVSRRNAMADAAVRLGSPEAPDLANAIKAQMSSVNTDLRAGRASAEARGLQWHERYLSGLTNDLDRAGLFDAARSNKLQRDWGRELYELSLKGEGNPGKTKNQVAMDIARIVDKYMSWSKENLNKSGAWIGDYAGYISRTVHDGDKIRRAGFDNWYAKIAPLLDWDRTYTGGPDLFGTPRGFLRNIYDEFVAGVHLSDANGVGMKDPAFTGPANLAEKLSAERVLHFRNADAWLDYQEAFGRGSLLEQVNGALGRSANALSLLDKFGTNPGAEFANDIAWMQQHFLHTHPEAVDKLGQKLPFLKAVFQQLTGEANRPANRLAANIGRYLRLDESLSKLGMVGFTHLSAIVTKAGELRYQGVPWMQAYGDFFTAPFRSFAHGEAAQWADETLAGMQGLHHEMISGFSPNDAVPGTASKLANLFFRMTGLPFLLNKQKAGTEWVLSRRAGMQFDRDFSALQPELRRVLRQNDISGAEWEVLRQAPDHVAIEGRPMLTPQAAMRAEDGAYHDLLRSRGEDVDNMTEETLDRKVAVAREGLMLKVHGWLSDSADRSVVTPGIEERARILGTSHPGTMQGEFWRFVAQFKMWPAAAIRQQWGRELYGREAGLNGGKIGGVLNLTVGSLIAGYAIMTLKDLLKGQTPRDPRDPKTALAAVMQGGGLGIAGDYLFGEYNRFGQSPTESALGPVLGQTATTAIDLWNRIKSHADGDAHPKDIGPEALKLLTDNLPFVNLFYTRQAFNYLFLHSLQETMNPGYLRRSEQRVKRQNNTTYWLSPANHLHTFGR